MATCSRTGVLFILIFAMLYAEHMVAEARRGGSFRGGSSRYTSSRYSSSRYTSTRYSARSGNRVRSRYISYIPAARYRRVYTVSYSSFYFYYYNMYFYYSGSYFYLRRSRPGPDAYVCANYEATANGTTMGVFTCPNTWEPSNFTYCCGQEYAEFCCDKRESDGLSPWVIAVITLAVLGGFFTCLGVCIKYCCCCECEKKTSTTIRETTVVSTVEASGPYLDFQPQSIPKAADPFQPPPYSAKPDMTNDMAPPGEFVQNDQPYPAMNQTAPYPTNDGATGPDPQSPPYPTTPNGQPQPYGIDNPSYESMNNATAPSAPPPAYEAIATKTT